MTYRDDVDTLYTRAMVLQRELDRTISRLAEREAELEKLRGPAPKPPADPPAPPVVRDQLPEHPPGATLMSRVQVLERARDRLGALDEEALIMVGTIIEELGDDEPTDKHELLERLRGIAEQISQSFWRRR
jgi:hypothetical protein